MARPNTDLDAGRTQLLELAESLIQQSGGVPVTLSELARAAGMSPANIYRFFESKETLYEAVAERWFAPKIRIMEEVVAADMPSREKLYLFFARRFILMRDNFHADQKLFRNYCAIGHEHDEIVRGYVDLADHYLAMVVADAMADGYFQGLSIDEVVSLINLAIQPYCNPKIMIDLMHRVSENRLRIIVNALLDGMKAGPPVALAVAA